MPGAERERAALEVDVLVVGGGVQGLCVLEALRARGLDSVLLVSRGALGAGETVHSHGYLQRGYALPPDAPLPAARGLAQAFPGWAAFLERHGLAEAGATYAGVPDASWERRWRELGLPFERAAPPDALADGHYRSAGRLYRTDERVFLGAAVVAALAAGAADHTMSGELVELRREPTARRVEACALRAGGDAVTVRPALVVLAAGRDNQRLLGGAAPGEEPHVLREVPMILLRGDALPAISGFFLDAKLSFATHVARDGERTVVATPLGGHVTSRADFDGRCDAKVWPGLVRDALERLQAIVPGLRGRLARGEVRLAAYCGPKRDHPSGLPVHAIGDAGLANLRHVAPIVFSLARVAAEEAVTELLATDAGRRALEQRRPLDARARALAAAQRPGLAPELRLSSDLAWYAPRDFRAVHGI